MLDGLPDPVLGHVLSFLHWKEKETLASASSRVSNVLWSSYGWRYFENTRQCSSLFQHGPLNPIGDHEKRVVKTFGKYFQHCKLWLRLSDFQSDFDSDSNILQLVSRHCDQLKSLCIVHPYHLSTSQIKQCDKSYLEPIRSLVFKRKGKCSIAMTRLFYGLKPNDHTLNGLENYFRLLIEHFIFPVLSCLDVSAGDISTIAAPLSKSNILCPSLDMAYFCYLRTLKCTIHLISTDILLCLLKGNLTYLYLVNNEFTRRTKFLEKDILDWRKIYLGISKEKRSRFEVNYVFQNRFLPCSHICPNPFVKSVVLSNLSNTISSSFSRYLAEIYGPYLHILAFYNSLWEENNMHFSNIRLEHNLSRLSKACSQLKVFLCSVPITSSALLNFVVSSKSLVHLRVYRDSIILLPKDKPFTEFQNKVSAVLNRNDWMVDRYNPSNIFDIPGVDTLLFTTCDT